MQHLQAASLPHAPYWLSFCALNTFQHLLTTAAQLAALESVRQVVVSGGLLLLDLLVAEPHYLASLDGRLTHEFTTTLSSGARLDKWTSRAYDATAQRIDTLVFYDTCDGQTGQVSRVVDRFQMRYIHRYELEHLLDRAGWRLISLFGSYDLEPYGSDAERMIALATWGSTRDEEE
jgi:hypothetical protein